MRRVSPTTSAHRRARTAGRGAVLFGVLALALLLVVRSAPASDTSTGFTVLGLFLTSGVAYWSAARRLSLQELTAHDGSTVADLSGHAPLLDPVMAPRDLLGRLRSLRSTPVCLVLDDDGWATVSTGLIVDVALAADLDVDVSALARPARWIDGDTPITALPRPPYAGEVWLVASRPLPLVFTNLHLHGDAATAAATDERPFEGPTAPRPSTISDVHT